MSASFRCRAALTDIHSGAACVRFAAKSVGRERRSRVSTGLEDGRPIWRAATLPTREVSMLASLLPGLREVRTPLAIGYLWLAVAWVTWGDRIPTHRPTDEGLIARLFDLSDLLGNTTLLAGLSFAAYIVGALLTIPVEGSFTNFFTSLPRRVHVPEILRYPEADDTRREYFAYLTDLSAGRPGHELFEAFLTTVADMGRQGDTARSVVMRSSTRYSMSVKRDDESPEVRATDVTVLSPELLRPRLLASGKTEVYGEYDRQAAEGAFRINTCAPLLALGLALGTTVAWPLIPLGLLVAAALLIQGCNRLAASVATIQRAAVNQLFVHPWKEFVDRASGASIKVEPARALRTSRAGISRPQISRPGSNRRA